VVLPDLLAPGLKVVFCGTAAGTSSARRGVYYAGPGNKFWDVLHRVGLTPTRFAPEEYRELLRYGIGLTDLNKNQAGMDSRLQERHFDRDALTEKIIRYGPKVLCFNGKRAAQAYYGSAGTGQFDYGRQPAAIGSTAVFVLPSTSAAAARWWDEGYWVEAAAYIKSLTLTGRNRS
jgi:TDG/mug DNA glycosylase family protein